MDKLEEYIKEQYELWQFRKDLHKDDNYARGHVKAYRDLIAFMKKLKEDGEL